ncbi:MAG: hypothetical protein VB855_06705 [Pirellulaceae bacterium]
MDQERGKIERYLAHKQVVFSPQAVQRYCHLFGANYLDVDFILQHHPGASFDESLGFFLKFCRLDLTPNPLTREKRKDLSLTSR